ncbi:hypothetical protein JB92DRAFT_2838432 [Gautieria morchelliformis]|nr:hypothetical protein JB92DRAFT_2838432 [Gautieria morchelliformis]
MATSNGNLPDHVMREAGMEPLNRGNQSLWRGSAPDVVRTLPGGHTRVWPDCTGCLRMGDRVEGMQPHLIAVYSVRRGRGTWWDMAGHKPRSALNPRNPQGLQHGDGERGTSGMVVCLWTEVYADVNLHRNPLAQLGTGAESGSRSLKQAQRMQNS